MSFKDKYIEKSKKIHEDKYDYSLVDYKNAKTKVKIICSVHGVFEQKPNNHLSGYGCYDCSKIKVKTDDFIKSSKKIHGDKYDYSLVDYKKANIDVDIICLEHGQFKQKPQYHLKCKTACKECTKRNIRLRTIKRIEKNKLNGNQLYPNFNEKACLIFDKISKKNNVNIKHAKNGGEFYIKELGYWVDGYDGFNNIVYEFDEFHHFDKNNKLRNKDIKRQNEIVDLLKCEFVRISDEN